MAPEPASVVNRVDGDVHGLVVQAGRFEQHFHSGRPSGERVRSAYQAQDIAPDRLLGREAELNELVAFCAAEQSYAWWQADPWAGKSALMAWFVLHPPPGVDVASFFVTARLAGQSDRDACATALIEQLAALAGESAEALLVAGAQRGTLLRLLEDAASRAREAGPPAGVSGRPQSVTTAPAFPTSLKIHVPSEPPSPITHYPLSTTS